jgi:hypothetical protein
MDEINQRLLKSVGDCGTRGSLSSSAPCHGDPPPPTDLILTLSSPPSHRCSGCAARVVVGSWSSASLGTTPACPGQPPLQSQPPRGTNLDALQNLWRYLCRTPVLTGGAPLPQTKETKRATEDGSDGLGGHELCSSCNCLFLQEIAVEDRCIIGCCLLDCVSLLPSFRYLLRYCSINRLR